MRNGFLLIALMLLSFAACSERQQGEVWNLIADSPAGTWEECFPLGNGHLGMMPDGGVDRETIVLNDISLWSGGPSDDSIPEF